VPISFRGEVEKLTISFAFIDEGQRSSARFSRFLEAYGGVIRDIETAEVAFVAIRPVSFETAHQLFQKHMPLRTSAKSACPRGVEHLIDWLEIRDKFHGRGISITPKEHRVLLEGDHLYRAPVHLGLIASWGNRSLDADGIRTLFRADSRRPVFETVLIEASYPKSIIPTAGWGMGTRQGRKPIQNVLFTNNLGETESTG
jgi:hypothetical protein